MFVSVFRRHMEQIAKPDDSTCPFCHRRISGAELGDGPAALVVDGFPGVRKIDLGGLVLRLAFAEVA